jgi:hypothetical protein
VSGLIQEVHVGQLRGGAPTLVLASTVDTFLFARHTIFTEATGTIEKDNPSVHIIFDENETVCFEIREVENLQVV